MSFPLCHMNETLLSIGKRLDKIYFNVVMDLNICVVINSCVCLSDLNITRCRFTSDNMDVNPSDMHFHSLNNLRLVSNVEGMWYVSILKNYRNLRYLFIGAADIILKTHILLMFGMMVDLGI